MYQSAFARSAKCVVAAKNIASHKSWLRSTIRSITFNAKNSETSDQGNHKITKDNRALKLKKLQDTKIICSLYVELFLQLL